MRILYVEDMRECYEKTKEAFRDEDVRWVKKITRSFDEIKKYLRKYDKAVVDVNLDFLKLESEEGLNIIRKLREFRRDLEIICVSSQDYKEKALEAGANKFVYKKEFWKRDGRQKRQIR